MKEILMIHNKVALVDDEDHGWLSGFSWHTRNGYAVHAKRVNGKVVSTLMHRLILGAKPGEIVDHINHNKLDNRRHNLRICNPKQSIQNTRHHKDAKNPYKGVTWYAGKKKWAARIFANQRRVFLGYFEIAEDAARAYNEAAKALFGEFACLNEVPND